MKPINEIRALFNVIKTETRRWFNTGARIDEVGQEILDHIEYLEQQFPLDISHPALNNKNAEPEFQHVDTTITKETLVQDDKVAIYDSVTGKIVLTNKSNVGGGSTDIISTNATNNTGTIVIDTTPNWQRVNISGGGNTLILDYANGTLPTKNREYLLVINNASASTITLTLPTVSFVKGGITYNFMNTTGSFPINSGKSIEVNVVFFFIDATTCNIRTLISPFI